MEYICSPSQKDMYILGPLVCKSWYEVFFLSTSIHPPRHSLWVLLVEYYTLAQGILNLSLPSGLNGCPRFMDST